MKPWRKQYLPPNSNDPQRNKRGHYTPHPPSHPTRPWEKYHLQKNNFIQPNPPQPLKFGQTPTKLLFSQKEHGSSPKNIPQDLYISVFRSHQRFLGSDTTPTPFDVCTLVYYFSTSLRIVNCPWRRNRGPVARACCVFRFIYIKKRGKLYYPIC